MSLLEKTIAAIEPVDQKSRELATERIGQLTMPYWALGRLLDLAVDLAGMTRTIQPTVARKAVVTMAADHGVVEEGVSHSPKEVTIQMVYNFVAGGAGINVLAKQAGAEVIVVDVGVDGDLSPLVKAGKIVDKKIALGTANFSKGPAMTLEQARRSIEVGIEVANELGSRIDLFGTGEMGIANTTPSSAIIATLTGESLDALVGCGCGINEEQRLHKVKVIEQGLALNQPDPNDGLDILAKVGGLEIGAIAGLILGAAAQKKPVLVDGFISTAGALIAQSLAPLATEYMLASHRSVEPGHQAMQAKLGKEPLLDLNLRLGEGTGAAVAMNLLEAGAALINEMATFEEAAVTNYIENGA